MKRMKSISRGLAAGVVSIGLAVASAISAAPASAVTAGSLTSNFVSDYDNEYSAMSPDKSVLAVSYYQSDEIYLIDTATGTPTLVTDSNSDLYRPGGLVFSPDGSTLYVANYASGSGNIVVINVATANVEDVLTSGDISGPWTIAISPDGGVLYIADYYQDTIVEYDLSTDATTSLASVSYPYQLFLSPDGSTLYNVDYYGEIEVYDTATGTSTTTWTDLAGYSPEIYGACTNSDMSMIYVVDNATGSLISVSTADGSVVETSAGDATTGASYCSVSPDDSVILVSDESIGDSSSPDYIATVPGQVSEYLASDLSLVNSVALANVAFAQQIQFSGDCTAWVTGYYGFGQTVELDSGACAASPELPNTGVDTSALAAAGGLALIVLTAGTLLVVTRRRSA